MNPTSLSKLSLFDPKDPQAQRFLAPASAFAEDETEDDDRDQRIHAPEPPSDDWGVYTVQEISRWTGLSRHRIYRKIRDLEIEARMAPTGRRKWLIPIQEARFLIHEGPDE